MFNILKCLQGVFSAADSFLTRFSASSYLYGIYFRTTSHSDNLVWLEWQWSCSNERSAWCYRAVGSADNEDTTKG